MSKLTREIKMMNILLTNDDGIFGLGLAAMYKALRRLGTVYVVAPASEQSGVAQALTFRHPLLVKDVFIQGERWGWAVEGTPADCVKYGVNVACPVKPDLVVSGMNWGQNCGTNIMYSGTLGAALEGGLYHIPSVAVSIQDDDHPNFERAAKIAVGIIEQILAKIGNEELSDLCGNPVPQVYNINFSRKALEAETPEIVVCPMDTTPYATELETHEGPYVKTCYWLKPTPRARKPEMMTDMNALGEGKIAVTPLRIDLTYTERLREMESWNLAVPTDSSCENGECAEDFRSCPEIYTRLVKPQLPAQ